MQNVIVKYDHLLNKLRENDFSEKEVIAIRTFINDIVNELPKLSKLTSEEYNNLENKDNKTFYAITNPTETAIIALFLGTLPITSFNAGVFGKNYFNTAIYQ